MKILWVTSVFLHPTTRGGQIRTLEMLKRLHRRHEIHFVALANPDEPEGPARASEYSSKSYPVPYRIADKRSPRFLAQLVGGLLSPVPVVISRKQSAAARKQISSLLKKESFDSVVCDFLTPSINMPELDGCVLFQHNVETMIWRRYAETAANPVRRAYMATQARRMLAYESRVCRSVRHVIAVSDVDAQLMRKLFGAQSVTPVPTGVDTEFFAPDKPVENKGDLVFVGSMDYMPNVDGILYFAREVLPKIHARRPECTLTVVGRKPPAEIRSLASSDARIRVTGTVPDVRPYLWGSSISIVPLRIGGGTRLKIYESMAAGAAVVSTTIGAEGLAVNPPCDIRIGDTPQVFAAQCLELLNHPIERETLAAAGRDLVTRRFSWEQVCGEFEQVLRTVSTRR